jgi:hypothetical protein
MKMHSDDQFPPIEGNPNNYGITPVFLICLTAIVFGVTIVHYI